MGAAAPVQDGALDAQVLGSPRQEVEATGLEVPLDRANLLSSHRNTECKQTRNAARRQITPRNTLICGSRPYKMCVISLRYFGHCLDPPRATSSKVLPL